MHFKLIRNILIIINIKKNINNNYNNMKIKKEIIILSHLLVYLLL